MNSIIKLHVIKNTENIKMRFAKNSKMSTTSKLYTAFTLAEILIVLGIIGIVAQMTIPTLVQNAQNAQMKAATKVAYSILSQAMTSAYNNNGGNLAGLCSDWNGTCLKNLLKPYLSYTKDCDNSIVTNGCWPSTSKFSDKSTLFSSPFWANDAGLILKNGMLVYIRFHNANCTYTSSDSQNYTCGWAAVDVNGFNNPNIVGKDTFGFSFQNGSVKPFGVTGDGDYFYTCSGSESGIYSGMGCTNQILYGN